MLKKGALMFLVILLALAMIACSNGGDSDDDNGVESDPSEEAAQDDDSEEAADEDSDETAQDDDAANEEAADESSETDDSAFEPSVPFPDEIPVYPGAVLYADLPNWDDTWQWLFTTTGSGNDIVEFFVDAFQEMGYEIDPEFTYAEREEFGITTADHSIQIYWLDYEGSIDDVDADTPNRWYGVILDPEDW